MSGMSQRHCPTASQSWIYLIFLLLILSLTLETATDKKNLNLMSSCCLVVELLSCLFAVEM